MICLLTLENIFHASGHHASMIHPILYKDQPRNDDTIMLALGKLSGQYLEEMTDGTKREKSIEEIKAMKTFLEVQIRYMHTSIYQEACKNMPENIVSV
jgi:hypothetical protein